MAANRVKELVAMGLIGDGVLAVVQPLRHEALWEQGPGWWTAMIAPFAGRPNLIRLVGAGLIVAGLWIASRQQAQPTAG